MAHLLHSGHHRNHRARHVARHLCGALLLCLATAVAYAEISKLYPGTGSSYYYAEQALLSKDKAFKYARVAKFIVGWGSHLYYWVYPGVMVATTGIFVGYVVGFLYPNFMSGSNPGPLFMALVAVLFSILRRLDRIEGCGRFDGRQSGHQRDSNLRAPDLQCAGHRLSHQPSGGITGLPIRWADAGHLRLPVRHGQGRLHPARYHDLGSSAPARRRRQDGTLHHRLSREGSCHGQLSNSHHSCIGRLAAQIQLLVYSGHGRHSDSGRL